MELACVTALAAEWAFELDTPWARELAATDASTDFGFGVARRRCSRRLVREVGRLAERRGDYIALVPEPGAEMPSRLGTPHLLNLRQNAFSTVLSVPARFPGHATLLETHGARMALEWISRTPAKHRSRVVLLIGSRAVLGAVSKGRSGAWLLRQQVRRVAALSLAAGIRLHCVYVPSERNPADAPSRGREVGEGNAETKARWT